MTGRGDTGWYPRWGKRTLDVLVGGAALIVTLPLQAIVALEVRHQLGRPILYRQARPGLDGRLFVMIKFRTMAEATDKFGRPLPDDQRLTQFGQRLRATSLDELPELWHVVRGEMSLVGPRPLLEKYLPLYTSTQQQRHDVRPGITGLAQCRGRNALDWHERLALDVHYARNVSLGLDLRIIAETAASVLRRTGISEPGCATVTEFTGSQAEPQEPTGGTANVRPAASG